MAMIHPNPIFEGMEKRLEVDFRPAPGAPARGLRAIPRETLDELMTLAACCIVSTRSNAATDAYVLSESSLFITEHKWVLKTCGTTRLLNSIPRLLEIAKELGLEPRRCKYSRATFLFPELQPFPYTSFDNEVEFLQSHFGALHPDGGNAYVMGDPFNGMQWHVYIADDMGALPASFKPTYNLEVCMTELGQQQAAQFFRGPHFVSAERTTLDSGIAGLKPGAIIDDYVFEPCGYSMNGIKDTGLLTIHITPEAHQSFASVEFSGHASDMPEPTALLASLYKMFGAGKMTVTLTVDRVVDEHGLAWGVVPELPAGYGMQGAASQLMPCGGKVCFYNLVEKLGQSPSSPRGPLHHAASFLSMASSATVCSSLANSDTEGDNNSEPGSASPTREL